MATTTVKNQKTQSDDAIRAQLRAALHARESDKFVELLASAPGLNVDETSSVQPMIAVAAQVNDLKAAQALIAHGANVNAFDMRGETALRAAAVRGDEGAALADVLLAHGAKPDVIDADGWTPLTLATEEGCVALTKVLLDRGADVNAATAGGKTPLMLAAQRGDEKLIDQLLNLGSELDARDRTDQSALFYAASSHRVRVVKQLLAAGADSAAVDRYGNTALHAAAITSPSSTRQGVTRQQSTVVLVEPNAGTIRALVEAGIPVDQRCAQGHTALREAVENMGCHSVEALLELGADPHAADDGGLSPLTRAISKGRIDASLAMIRHGADANHCDIHGRFALRSAIDADAEEAFALLLPKTTAERLAEAAEFALAQAQELCSRNIEGGFSWASVKLQMFDRIASKLEPELGGALAQQAVNFVQSVPGAAAAKLPEALARSHAMVERAELKAAASTASPANPSREPSPNAASAAPPRRSIRL
jgi:ankyrin repeat protein